jgi:hypothetical protein
MPPTSPRTSPTDTPGPPSELVTVFRFSMSISPYPLFAFLTLHLPLLTAFPAFPGLQDQLLES